MEDSGEGLGGSSADERTVRDVLARVVEPDAVAALDVDHAFHEIASWDSLVQVSFIAALEECFDVQLTFDEILLIQSLSTSLTAVESARRRAVQ